MPIIFIPGNSQFHNGLAGFTDSLLSTTLYPQIPQIRVLRPESFNASQMVYNLVVAWADVTASRAAHGNKTWRVPVQYEDFDVSIEALPGRDYRVVVHQSPAGKAQENVPFPFDTVALELHLAKLENALLKSSGQRRRVPSQEEQAVLAFGKSLFEFLMHGEIGRRYEVSYDRCQREEKGLRLKLRIQDPTLAALPWEFLYDQRFDQYLALSQRTPLLRYLELPRPLRPLRLTPPLRLLGMVANPQNLPPLDVAREKERIKQAVADLQAEGLLELTWLQGQGWRDLQRAMRRGPWHIFHFIGHGGFDLVRDEGYLYFADAQGEARRMSARNLAGLLGDHDPLRVVLLNACEGGQSGADVFSSTAASLVRGGLPCVLAMQYAITDDAAIEFARTFYEALADGSPIETTVSDARKSIFLHREGSLEWGTPVLFTHAPDGVLFDLAAAPARPEPEPPPPEPPRPPRLKLPWRLNPRGLPMIETWEQLTAVDELPPRILWLPDQKEMALVPAGDFLMGTPEAKARQLEDWLKLEYLLTETPQRRVTLPDYYLDVTPVTHAEYARFIAANPDHPVPTGTYPLSQPHSWDEKRRQPPDAVRHHPVVLVDWHSAQAYARWAGKALPSEEQWEKGARGSDGRLYPWGNDWDRQRVNSAERHHGGEFKNSQKWWAWWKPIRDAKKTPGIFTSPVGAYPAGASPYGLLDMAGNVWEWCDAWYDAYPGSRAQHEDFGRKNRVVRGGSWVIHRHDLRCADRSRITPDYRDINVGFRCASTAF
ncbi:MAG: SUMF1/EgtB/PvdO family nonheme iron enzyme [Anaerolineae bacterium]|nr:SUMF1/EgtB/PvdO family nonheme iron enzyme [Anaerolineae bacterium]